MRPISLMANTHHPQYDSGHEFSSSPPAQNAGLIMDGGPPPSPDMYGPLSPPISGSDTSAEGAYHSRNSSTSSSRANSLVHRNPLRYNPTPSPSGSSGRRRGRSFGDSDEDMGVNIAESIAYTRKEATRRQRIEAEQRRRDELRDGYARLKDVLPVSNQKSSKVSLLERGTVYLLTFHSFFSFPSFVTQPPFPISNQPHCSVGKVEPAIAEKNTGLEC
jgi:Helix-loop-helix DNA-binding domain